MSSADYRHIAFGGDGSNCERLFRAAISAYCALARPTRRELTQLDDLALGLFDRVSANARRFAAAALCECTLAPPGLVRRLSDEPVDICAPLLVRSQALSDVDLIALIGRHGLPHARAIGRREKLNPTIAALIRLLQASAKSETAGKPEAEEDPLEAMRKQLRELMREAERHGAEEDSRTQPPTDAGQAFSLLRKAALTDDSYAFSATLARVLGLSTDRARRLTGGITYSDLLTGLRALQLSAEQAFIIAASTFPAQVNHPAAIRLFLERYSAMNEEKAREKVEMWRLGDRPEPLNPSSADHSLASAR